MEHTVVHFEIPATDPEALSKFYTDLFGWKIEKSTTDGMEYWMVDPGGAPAGGIMARMHPQQTPINYIQVEDMDAYIARAEELKATVVWPKTAIGTMGWACCIVDPQGNAFGLWQGAPGV